MIFKYLKEEGFYCDLYDLMTIKECLRIRDYWGKRVKDSKGDMVKIVGWGLDFQLYFVKGERYRNKVIILQEWMDRDRKRDEKLNGVEEPEGIRCLK